MGCNDKIKNMCGSKIPATCVPTEVTVNDDSSLKGESCLVVEETTQDIYTQIGEVRAEIKLTLPDTNCITYDKNAKGNVEVKEFVTKANAKLCDLENRVKVLEEKSICSYPIASCNFTLGTLVDSCGTQPSTMGELLQILINKFNT